MIIKKLLKDDKGAIIPLVALLLIILLGFTALAVDAGSLYLSRRQMATAADAGALAGAKELSDSNNANEARAKEIAKKIAEDNGADVGSVSADIKIINNMHVIEVIAKKNTKMTFARLFGFTDVDVDAKSVASWGYIKDFTNGSMMPLFFIEDEMNKAEIGAADLKEGKIKVLYDGQEVEIDNSYGFLKVGSGMDDIKSVLRADNYTIPSSITNNIKIGGVIDSATGNKNALVGPIEDRMDKALAIEVGDEGKIPARKQFMSGLIPIVDADEFIELNFELEYVYDKEGELKEIKLKKKIYNPPKVPIKYFATYEIQDVLEKQNLGTSHALDKVTYERVTASQPYPGQSIGTVKGEFTKTHVAVNIDDINNNNQDNPNPGGYAAKWFQLIDVDYIGNK